ncbi:MAG: nuclear transport factor 2 family protein [Actinomycetota bacterium]
MQTHMSERDAIIETITKLFWHTDHHDWSSVEAVFADRVDLDYTSLQGGERTSLTADAIVGGWADHFATMDAHQHLVTNHLVTRSDDTARVTAQFIATHQTGDAVWTLGGDYEFDLLDDGAGWRISSMTMTAVWQHPGDVPSAP